LIFAYYKAIFACLPDKQVFHIKVAKGKHKLSEILAATAGPDKKPTNH
jgi:hypothetical protein